MNGRIKKTGVFGGTFNPPHTGHLQAARNFLRRFDLDRLLIIPSNIPPHKENGSIADPAKRLDMCRLAFGSEKKAEISDIEIKKGGRSYTFDTMQLLYDIYGRKDHLIYFLCGTDMFESIESWYKYEELLALCVFVVTMRTADGDKYRSLIKKAEYFNSRGFKVEVTDEKPVEISSTAVRGLIKDRSEKAADYLTPEVYDYIKKENLYR